MSTSQPIGLSFGEGIWRGYRDLHSVNMWVRFPTLLRGKKSKDQKEIRKIRRKWKKEQNWFEVKLPLLSLAGDRDISYLNTSHTSVIPHNQKWNEENMNKKKKKISRNINTFTLLIPLPHAHSSLPNYKVSPHRARSDSDQNRKWGGDGKS